MGDSGRYLFHDIMIPLQEKLDITVNSTISVHHALKPP